MLSEVILSGEAVGSLTITIVSWTVHVLLVVHGFYMALHVSLAAEGSAMPMSVKAIFLGAVLWFFGFSVPQSVLLTAWETGETNGR